MIIDMHGHIGDLRTPGSLDRTPIAVEDLICRLDDEGIDKAAVLPWPPCPWCPWKSPRHLTDPVSHLKISRSASGMQSHWSVHCDSGIGC